MRRIATFTVLAAAAFAGASALAAFAPANAATAKTVKVAILRMGCLLAMF